MNLTCPLCKSEDITDDSDYQSLRNNKGGYTSFKVKDNHFCNKCGVVFKDVREL